MIKFALLSLAIMSFSAQGRKPLIKNCLDETVFKQNPICSGVVDTIKFKSIDCLKTTNPLCMKVKIPHANKFVNCSLKPVQRSYAKYCQTVPDPSTVHLINCHELGDGYEAGRCEQVEVLWHQMVKARLP